MFNMALEACVLHVAFIQVHVKFIIPAALQGMSAVHG